MKPNETELIILKTLWRQPDITMRDIHAACGEDMGWAFSTLRTTVSRMAEKGFITITKPHGVAVHSAALEKVPTIALLAQDFMRRVLELDRPLSIAAFSGSQILSEDDIEDLKKLIENTDTEADGT
jgi:predicted transcriptional regulator